MFSSHHSSNPLSPREDVTHLVITEDTHTHTPFYLGLIQYINSKITVCATAWLSVLLHDLAQKNHIP